MKLTKSTIDRANYTGDGKSRHVQWDDSVPGFGLRIYPTGKKSFVLSYRVAGRKRLMSIAPYGVMTLEQARKKARAFLVGLEEEIDPLEARRERSKGESVKDLCGAYIRDYAKQQKKSWKDDERRIYNRILPLWGNLKANSIKHSDVAALHRKVGGEFPYEANRMVEMLSKIFSLAERWGFVPEDFKNPAKNVEYFKEEKRDRWVTPKELPKIMEAVDKEEIYPSAAIWLYLLTGARKTEILQSKWENVDLERRELRIPDTKAGRVHYLPLSQPAIEILNNLPRMKGNPYVLPGLKEKSHLVNIDKPWRRIRKAAGVEDVRLHDLRRTVGSWLAQSGNSLHLIGKVLNHSSQSTTAVYARFAQDQVRDALEQHGQKIMGIAGKGKSADVVEL